MIWRIMQFEEGVLLTLAGDTLQELHNFQIIQKPDRFSAQLTSLVLILQAWSPNMINAFIARGFCDIHHNQDLCRLIKLAETLIRPDITKTESYHN